MSFRRIVLATPLFCFACAPESTLDDTIREYLDLRYASVQNACECYHIFVDQDDPDLPYFESEQDCLASYPAPTDEAIHCIEDVLATGPYTEAGNIEVIECLAEAVRVDMACFSDEVSGTCSTSAYQDCSAMNTSSLCGQALTADQRGTIMHCGRQ